MKEYEEIPVFLKRKEGRLVCICLKGHKRCREPCERELLIRDKFKGWQNTMPKDKWGR